MTANDLAKDSLRLTVESLLDDIHKLAIDRLDKIERSGVGIVQDHIDNDMNYAIPKDFIVALAYEIADVYQRHNPSVKDKKRIRNYYLHM